MNSSKILYPILPARSSHGNLLAFIVEVISGDLYNLFSITLLILTTQFPFLYTLHGYKKKKTLSEIKQEKWKIKLKFMNSEYTVG